MVRVVLRFVFLCCLFTSRLFAQGNFYVEDVNKFFGGLTAGANFSQMDGDNYLGYDKVGLNVGGVIYTFLTPELGASMEILYTQKGSFGKGVTDKGVKGIAVKDYQAELSYAEVPLMLHYFFRSKHHAGIGLSLSRLVQSHESAIVIPDQGFDQFQHPFKKYMIDFVVGGNIRIWKGLFINPRFQYSVIKIRGQAKTPDYFGRDQFSRLLTFRVTYLFGLK
jgi:hypothetical protein